MKSKNIIAVTLLLFVASLTRGQMIFEFNIPDNPGDLSSLSGTSHENPQLSMTLEALSDWQGLGGPNRFVHSPPNPPYVLNNSLTMDTGNGVHLFRVKFNVDIIGFYLNYFGYSSLTRGNSGTLPNNDDVCTDDTVELELPSGSQNGNQYFAYGADVGYRNDFTLEAGQWVTVKYTDVNQNNNYGQSWTTDLQHIRVIVPEPSTYALILALVIVVFCVRKRMQDR